MAEEPAPVENGHVEQPDAAANGAGKKSKAEKKKEKKQKHKQNRQQRRYCCSCYCCRWQSGEQHAMACVDSLLLLVY